MNATEFWPAAGESKFIGLFFRFSGPDIVVSESSAPEIADHHFGLVWFDLLWSKRDIECLLDPLAHALGQAALSRPGAR